MVDGQSTEDRGWTHAAGDASPPVSKGLRSSHASVDARPDWRDRCRACWHPYSTIGDAAWWWRWARRRVADADRRRTQEVLDAMASWWTAIHGRNHPVLDAAIAARLAMNHVMFGGLTHEPAARLAQLLVQITPDGPTRCSSATRQIVGGGRRQDGVAYWRSRPPPQAPADLARYHGDTTPMSVATPTAACTRWTVRSRPPGIRAAGADRLRPGLQRRVRKAVVRARGRAGRRDRRTGGRAQAACGSTIPV